MARLYCAPKTVKSRITKVRNSGNRVVKLAGNRRCSAASKELSRWLAYIKSLNNCHLGSVPKAKYTAIRRQRIRIDAKLRGWCM